jgi:nitrate/TMAO reductase-like tetraheme cytochrome c subunit
MTQKPTAIKKKPFPLIPTLLAIAVVGVLAAAGGFAFAAIQESQDPFCGSCHTQPESTFLQQSTASQAVTMSSYHASKETHCIDCHSGPGISGRIQAELLGASNAFKWFTGTAVQPAVLLYPIADANCLKCHQNVTQRGFTPKESITVPGIRAERGGGEGGVGHWHQNLARWQSTTANAATCTTCHSGHITGGTAQSGFMVSQKVQATCDACHKVMRRD